MPVTPPSMKRLESRKPWRPIPAEKMPKMMKSALPISRRSHFMGSRILSGARGRNLFGDRAHVFKSDTNAT